VTAIIPIEASRGGKEGQFRRGPTGAGQREAGEAERLDVAVC